MNLSHKIVYLESPEIDAPSEAAMRFRLTYAGPLFAIQRDPTGTQVDPKSGHKHTLRKVFHKQLKRLWHVTPFLNQDADGEWQIRTRQTFMGGGEPHSPEVLAARYALYGFNFVPLVTHDTELYCSLDVLFLRPDRPGGLWAGDIDNRVKTLIDSLRLPMANEEYVKKAATDDEKPFYCLLEEDQLITKLSVETDQMLEFVTPGEGHLNDVRLTITVHLWPYAMHLGNLEFGGGG
jgi:hypothetical protein